MRGHLLARRVAAWSISVTQVVILTECAVFFAWSGSWFSAEFALPGSIACALVGALIVSQPVHFRFGWFLLLAPVPALVSFVASEYVDLVEIHHVVLPFERTVWWVGNWAWAPSFGMAIGMLTVRFPDGYVSRGWRFVDWLCITGTVLFAGGIASVDYPGASTVTPTAAAVIYGGLVLIAAGAVGAMASLVARYRRGTRDVRLQLKWILLATGVVTVAFVYVAVFGLAAKTDLSLALIPSYVSLVFIPISIGIAILRHRLFDIDLIISRTLVYAIVTGILGGLYIGIIELTQQLSILYTGQRSETAIVVTAFVVAGAFTPVQKWVESKVERRFRGGDVAGRLQHVSSTAEAAIRVIDPHRFAKWLVNESVAGFDAEGGAIYLRDHALLPFHQLGSLDGGTVVDLAVRHEGREMGRLLLGRRRGGADYSHRDVEALKRSAAALGEALAVASELGHLAEPAAMPATAGRDGVAVPATRS
jgi:hypothetical protein